MPLSEETFSAFVLVGAAVLAFGKRRKASWVTIATWLLFAATIFLIAVFTILPVPIDAKGWRGNRIESFPTLIPFRTIRVYLAHGLVRTEARQLFGNIALFVPFGIAVPLAIPRFRRGLVAVTVAALLALVIEIAQMLLPGHGADVDDVILNTTGAAIGYCVYRSGAVLSRRVRRP